MVLFFTSTICNKSCVVYTPPVSISLAICRRCDTCIFNVRNKYVVVVVVKKTTRNSSWQEVPRGCIVLACLLACSRHSHLALFVNGIVQEKFISKNHLKGLHISQSENLFKEPNILKFKG